MLEEWPLWFNFSDGASAARSARSARSPPLPSSLADGISLAPLLPGDKDVFRFAFLALRKRWGVPGRFVGQGAFPSGTASGSCVSPPPVQLRLQHP